jgi:Protein of unknown function (DUF3054)
MVGSRIVSRLAAVFDFAAVVLFVGIGRSVHHHAESARGLFSTTWPFAVGLAIGWVVVVASRRRVMTPLCGVVVTLVTVSVGMILRVLSGQGTAVAFIAVALGFLGAVMVGWRLVMVAARARHTRVER